jgi:hypothetical protein
VPVVLALWTPAYNRIEPRLGAVPFFYWSQFALVGVGMLVTGVVYALTKPRDKR